MRPGPAPSTDTVGVADSVVPRLGREATGDGWGLVVFAGVMMILLGSFHAVAGLSAIASFLFIRAVAA